MGRFQSIRNLSGPECTIERVRRQRRRRRVEKEEKEETIQI
jgi:hypothetical protein